MTAPAVTGLRTVEVDPITDPRWESLVRIRPSDVFHSPAWSRVLAETYGFSPRATIVLDADGTPRSGLAYVDVDDARGRRIVSLPFSDFCDPILADPSDWAALAGPLLLAEVPVSLRCLRETIDDRLWTETASFAWHGIDVRRDPDEVWESIDAGARRAIRKARAGGVEVKPATTEADLRAFFEMHLRVRKLKYGMLAQPWRFFQAIWEQFLVPGDGALLLARRDGAVAGGVLYLRWNDTLYYKFNASSPDLLEVRPNDLLAWEGLALAREMGLDWFDFGVSDWDQEGLVRYKRKYATEEGVVRKFSGGPPSHDPLGATLGELTRVLVDPSVPDAATERAGDLLYGYFC